MKTIFVVALFFTIGNVHAQFDGLFKRTTDAVQRKVEQKVNEKINEGVDKGIDKAEDVITGRKKNGREGKSPSRKEVRDETAESPVFESGELLFQTSINTAAGKEKMENILRETDGVSSVSIDSETGMVYITPSSDKSINDIVQDVIKKNGFTVKPKSNKK